MKKLLYLLLLLPLGLLASCQDDDDLPSVDVTVTFDNASYTDGTLYVPQSEDLTLQGISVAATNGSNATIANVAYYWDGVFQPGLTFGTYPMTLNTSEWSASRHGLGMEFTILEQDKSLAYGSIYYPVVIYDPDNAPAGIAAPGQVSIVSHLNFKKK